MAAAGSSADVLVISKAEVVLHEIELKPAEVASCNVTPKPAGCREFEVGPIRLEIPTGAGVQTRVTVDLPAGTYREVDFEVHKLTSDDPAEAAFRQANPDLVNKSVRVTGTFNGQPFVYESDLEVEQELVLSPALVVSESSPGTNLTVQVKLGDWFRNSSGVLIDPATANKNGANESIVKENIKRSMRAFEDRDQNGIEG
jgi:hypothetical protein